ncbi:MAG: 6-phospho-beta-glucosidase, partial [Nonomuraea sp.]|nr:6-phospho-beta-glucosidase [Nonomuraea sp.]
LPALLDSGDLERVEEARVLGTDWVRTLGVLPNEYLYYYYFTREAIAATRRETRGEALLGQQSRFYDAALADPAGARAAWERTRRERDESYMAEARSQARDLADLEAGGYEGIAVELLAALGSATPVTMILNVANGTAVPGLPAEAVVEVPCAVSSGGIVPLATRPLEGAFLGLLQQVKAVEQAAVEAALTGSSRLAAAALAQHPLVDSAGTARQLLDGYRARIPSLDAVFTS